MRKYFYNSRFLLVDLESICRIQVKTKIHVPEFEKVSETDHFHFMDGFCGLVLMLQLQSRSWHRWMDLAITVVVLMHGACRTGSK